MTALVIVIDDEILILEYVERVLRPHFSVLTCSSVEEALPSLGQASLIISDFQMPGLGGAGLIEYLNQTEPRPLLIISGLGANAPELERARELRIPILGKPFSPEELLRAVRTLLN